MGFFGRLFGSKGSEPSDPIETIEGAVKARIDGSGVASVTMPLRILLSGEGVSSEGLDRLCLLGGVVLQRLLDEGYHLADQTKDGFGLLDLPKEHQAMALMFAVRTMEREGCERCSLVVLPKERARAEQILAGLATHTGVPVEPITSLTDSFTLRLGLLEKRLGHIGGDDARDAPDTEVAIEEQLQAQGFEFVHGEVATWFRAIGGGGRHGELVFPSLANALALLVLGRTLYAGEGALVRGSSALYAEPWLPIVSAGDGGDTVWEVLLADGEPDRVRKRSGHDAVPFAENLGAALDQLVPVRGFERSAS